MAAAGNCLFIPAGLWVFFNSCRGQAIRVGQAIRGGNIHGNSGAEAYCPAPWELILAQCRLCLTVLPVVCIVSKAIRGSCCGFPLGSI